MFHPTIGQLCSSISQHNCHLRAGHDFHKEKGNNRLMHSQIHTKVQPSQSKVGFIKLLRQWKGCISKLVSSTTELWTPAQDLSSLASTIPTHPTQGSIPFTATQSLMPILPFQCSSRVSIEYLLAPLDLSVWFISSLGLSSQFWPLPLLMVQTKARIYRKTKH